MVSPVRFLLGGNRSETSPFAADDLAKPSVPADANERRILARRCEDDEGGDTERSG
jgi:hypothetical protein